MTTDQRTVVLVGTLDTKGPEHAFVRDRLLGAGRILATKVDGATGPTAVLLLLGGCVETFIGLWAAGRPPSPGRDH